MTIFVNPRNGIKKMWVWESFCPSCSTYSTHYYNLAAREPSCLLNGMGVSIWGSLLLIFSRPCLSHCIRPLTIMARNPTSSDAIAATKCGQPELSFFYENGLAPAGWRLKCVRVFAYDWNGAVICIGDEFNSCRWSNDVTKHAETRRFFEEFGSALYMLLRFALWLST